LPQWAGKIVSQGWQMGNIVILRLQVPGPTGELVHR